MSTYHGTCVEDAVSVDRTSAQSTGAGIAGAGRRPAGSHRPAFRDDRPAAREGRPAPRDERSFRTLMGRYPTGVVLVTAATPDGPVGMAVNSFASVSLTPPLVSFCAALTSDTWARLKRVPGFAVNILGGDHEDVCRLFARHGADRFAEHAWTTTPDGHPLLADAVGWIDTRVEHVHPAGDHDLVIARASGWSDPRSHAPLVFYSGRFHALEGDTP